MFLFCRRVQTQSTASPTKRLLDGRYGGSPRLVPLRGENPDLVGLKQDEGRGSLGSSRHWELRGRASAVLCKHTCPASVHDISTATALGGRKCKRPQPETLEPGLRLSAEITFPAFVLIAAASGSHCGQQVAVSGRLFAQRLRRRWWKTYQTNNGLFATRDPVLAPGCGWLGPSHH